MADVKSTFDEVRGQLPPEVEQKLNEAVNNLKDQDPATLALHLVAGYLIVKGVFRVLRGRLFGGLTFIGMGVGVLLAGNEIASGISDGLTGETGAPNGASA